MAIKSIPQRLSLVQSVSRETVTTLEELLYRAKEGEVIGLAFCAVIKRRNYIVDLSGEARTSPTFARGMISALDDHAKRLVHRE